MQLENVMQRRNDGFGRVSRETFRTPKGVLKYGISPDTQASALHGCTRVMAKKVAEVPEA